MQTWSVGVINFFSGVFSLIGVVASLIAIRSFLKKPKKYEGNIDAKLIYFIDKNHDEIFYLHLFLTEEESSYVRKALENSNGDDRLRFSIPHDDYGTELSFYLNDPELIWNMRFLSAIHTYGYFKYHSGQGPYQGWMTMTLKAVPKEAVLK